MVCRVSKIDVFPITHLHFCPYTLHASCFMYSKIQSEISNGMICLDH